jgi:hypothetical protein
MMRTLKASSTKTFISSTVRRRASLLGFAVAALFFASVASALAGTVTISGAGTGSGVVTVTGATKGTLINCTLTAGVASGTCKATFGSAELDTVEVVPGSGSAFARWSTSTGGTSSTCTEAVNPCAFKDTVGAVALTAELEKPAVAGVTTDAASNVTIEGAKLNGSLQPEGTAAEYFFEYGTSTAYEHSTPTKTSSSGGVVLLSEALPGLMPLTTYHYRIVARRMIEGKERESVGRDEPFTTLGVPPEIRSESASAITPFSATLEAAINPGNSATSYYFMYGTSPTSEQAALPAATAAGYGSVQVTPRVLQALQPSTTYYYHVVAENTFGKVEGIEGPKGPEEKTFTTLPASAPEASLGQIGEIGQTTANLTTTINPNGLATEYEIQIATSGVYTPVAVESAGQESTPQSAGYTLTGLAPATIYQVRIVAWNTAGETTSTVQTLTTAGAPAPSFTQPPASVLVPFTPAVAPSGETTAPTAKAKPLTNAQKLAKALKACKKDKSKGKRATCEKQARKRYATTKAKKKKKKG